MTSIFLVLLFPSPFYIQTSSQFPCLWNLFDIYLHWSEYYKGVLDLYCVAVDSLRQLLCCVLHDWRKKEEEARVKWQTLRLTTWLFTFECPFSNDYWCRSDRTLLFDLRSKPHSIVCYGIYLGFLPQYFKQMGQEYSYFTLYAQRSVLIALFHSYVYVEAAFQCSWLELSSWKKEKENFRFSF